MSKPYLCIHHGNCADGFGAAWVVRHFYGPDKVEFFPGVHGAPPPDVTGRDVIIVDFSYKRPVLEQMIEQCNSMVILDHHETAQKDLDGIFEHPKVDGAFLMQYSGAMMAWNWYFNEFPKSASLLDHKMVRPPELLGYIQDRDLWRFEKDRSREVSMALFSYEYDFELWDTLMLELPIDVLKVEGEAILRKHMKDIHELLDVMTVQLEVAGYTVPAANLPYTMASDAAGILAEGQPFAACWYTRSDGGWVVSLRSREGGINVADVAAFYGGGGHANAAGFQLEPGESL